MAKPKTEAELLPRANGLLWGVYCAIDAALDDVSESYPEADREYAQNVLKHLREKLSCARCYFITEFRKQLDAAKDK